MVIMIIGLVTLFLGIIGITLFFSGALDYDLVYWLSFAAIIVGISTILMAVGINDNKRKPIEYPSDKYRLELKVIEYQEARDTIYVLIPKEEKK